MENQSSPKIDEIMKEIFALDEPKIDNSQPEKIKNFAKVTINGDIPEGYLVINANINKDVSGAIVYVLTNLRLIKIEIDKDIKEISSSSFPIDTLVEIVRKLLPDGRAAIELSFPKGSFGLRYDSNDQKIISFFQKLEHSWASSKNG